MKKIKKPKARKGNKCPNVKLDPEHKLAIDIDISFDPKRSAQENTRAAFYRIMYEANYRDITNTQLDEALDLIRFDLLGDENIQMEANMDQLRMLQARTAGVWEDVSMLHSKWKHKFGYTSFLDQMLQSGELNENQITFVEYPHSK